MARRLADNFLMPWGAPKIFAVSSNKFACFLNFFNIVETTLDLTSEDPVSSSGPVTL